MLQNSTQTKKFKCHLVKNNDILDQKSYPCFSNGWKGKLASIAMRLSNIATEKKKLFSTSALWCWRRFLYFGWGFFILWCSCSSSCRKCNGKRRKRRKLTCAFSAPDSSAKTGSNISISFHILLVGQELNTTWAKRWWLASSASAMISMNSHDLYHCFENCCCCCRSSLRLCEATTLPECFGQWLGQLSRL